MKLHAIFEITPQQEDYLRSALARLGGEIEHGGLEINVEAEPSAPQAPTDAIPVPSAAELEMIAGEVVAPQVEAIESSAVEPLAEVVSTDSEQPGAQAPTDNSGAREQSVGNPEIVPKE